MSLAIAASKGNPRLREISEAVHLARQLHDEFLAAEPGTWERSYRGACRKVAMDNARALMGGATQ